MRTTGNTKQKAIVEAQKLLQKTGYNGFTFQLLADEIGIKKPSLYEHFESKEDLGVQVIEEAVRVFLEWTETISVFEPDAQLGALFELFYKFSGDERLCPISALVGDYSVYPKKMRAGLLKMYESRRVWIEEIIKRGQQKNIFNKNKSAKEYAEMVISLGFGAQMIARVTQNPECIKAQKKLVLEMLEK